MASIPSGMFSGPRANEAVVPFRHAVLGAVRSHHGRRRHPRRPLHDCGGLELADDTLNSSVSPLVALPGSGRQLFEQDEANCLVEPEKLPDRSVTDATAANLPNAHDGIAFLGPATSVDLHNTHVPVVSDLKAVAALESLASDGSIASSIPLRASKI